MIETELIKRKGIIFPDTGKFVLPKWKFLFYRLQFWKWRYIKEIEILIRRG